MADSNEPIMVVELHLVVPEFGHEATTVLVKNIEVTEETLTNLISMVQFSGATFGGEVVE